MTVTFAGEYHGDWGRPITDTTLLDTYTEVTGPESAFWPSDFADDDDQVSDVRVRVLYAEQVTMKVWRAT